MALKVKLGNEVLLKEDIALIEVESYIDKKTNFFPVLAGLTLLEVIIELYPHSFKWRQSSSSDYRL